MACRLFGLSGFFIFHALILSILVPIGKRSDCRSCSFPAGWYNLTVRFCVKYLREFYIKIQVTTQQYCQNIYLKEIHLNSCFLSHSQNGWGSVQNSTFGNSSARLRHLNVGVCTGAHQRSLLRSSRCLKALGVLKVPEVPTWRWQLELTPFRRGQQR